MKINKYTIVLLIGAFLLSIVPVTNTKAPGVTGPEPGLTVSYKVTTFDVPLEDMMEEDFPGTFVLDLTDSIIKFKILKSEGEIYTTGAYFVLGKAITIDIDETQLPENETIPSSLTSIEIPAGFAFPIKTEGEINSDPKEVFAEENGSLPFLIVTDETGWADLKTDLETDLGENVTVINGDTYFEVTVIGEDENATDIIGEMKWHKEKGFLWSADVTMNAWPENATEPVPMALGFEYDSEEVIGLALELGKVYSFDAVTATADMDAKSSITTQESLELFNNLDFIMNGMIVNMVEDLEGETVKEWKITEIDGCFYKADVTSLNMTTLLLETENDVWTNGFSSFGSVAITSDWDLWKGLFKGVTSLQNVYLGLIHPDTAETDILDLYTEYGITLETLESTVALNEESPFVYITATSTIKGTIDYNNETTGEKVFIDLFFDSFEETIYNEEGILQSMELKNKIDIELDIISFKEEDNETTTEHIAGDINSDIHLIIENKEFIRSSSSSESETMSIPGFDLFSVLAVLAVVPIIYIGRRRKK